MTTPLDLIPEIPAEASEGLASAIAVPAGPAVAAPARAEPAPTDMALPKAEPEPEHQLRAARNLTWNHQGSRTVQAAQGLIDRLDAKEAPLSPMERCKKSFAEGYIQGYKAVDGWKNGITNRQTRDSLAKYGDRKVVQLDSLRPGVVHDLRVVAAEERRNGTGRIFAEMEGTNFLVAFNASRSQISALGDSAPLIGDKLLLTKKEDKSIEVISTRRALELADKLTVTKGKEARSAGMER